MENQTFVSRAETIINEYVALFGGEDQLPGDLATAQADLEALMLAQKQTELLQTKVKDDGEKHISSAERLQEYDQFLQSENRKRTNEDISDLLSLSTSGKPETSNRIKSKLEVLAEERDYKRRRQSYKGAKASSTKRSYTEIIRDVIETQSEMLRSMNSHQQVKTEPKFYT